MLNVFVLYTERQWRTNICLKNLIRKVNLRWFRKHDIYKTNTVHYTRVIGYPTAESLLGVVLRYVYIYMYIYIYIHNFHLIRRASFVCVYLCVCLYVCVCVCVCVRISVRAWVCMGVLTHSLNHAINQIMILRKQTFLENVMHIDNEFLR